MDIGNLDKAEVLAALYNASRPQGMGLLHYTPEPMTVQEARNHLSNKTYFDYLNGRAMKVDLSGDDLKTLLYNTDNGDGATERAIAELREKKP